MDNETTIIMLLSALSIVSGLLVSCVKYCYRSKCEEIHLCYNFVDIRRNTGNEHRDLESSETNELPKMNDVIQHMATHRV